MLNDTALNVKIPKRLYDELKAASERKSISLASLVRIACSEWLEKESNGPPVAGRNINDKKFKAVSDGGTNV